MNPEYVLYQILDFRLEAPNLELDGDKLVTAHDWLGLVLPSIPQRPSSSHFRVKGGRIGIGLHRLIDLVLGNVHMNDFSQGQLFWR